MYIGTTELLFMDSDGRKRITIFQLHSFITLNTRSQSTVLTVYVYIINELQLQENIYDQIKNISITTLTTLLAKNVLKHQLQGSIL